MDLFEAMRCAPTSRRFGQEDVAPAAIERALDAARFAPSGGNRQGWRVVVVRDAQLRAALRDLYLPRWRAYTEQTGAAAMLADPDAFDPARVRMVRRADEYAERLAEVPVHLVIGVRLGDLAVTDAALPRQSIVGGASIYPFVQNLLLALRAEGLGAAMTTLLVPAEAEVKRLLAIPEEVALAAHVGVGHRAEPWPGRLAPPGSGVRVLRALRRGAHVAGGIGAELKGVVPGATASPSPVTPLAYASSLASVPTPLLAGTGASSTVESTPSASPLASMKALPESPGMPGVSV